PLPAEQIATALKAVRSGEDPTATKLPPAKAADVSSVRNLPPPVGAGAWKAAVDAGPKSKALSANLTLLGKVNDITRILFAAPDAAQAAALTAAGAAAVGTQKQVHADRYDLAGGKHLGGLDLFSAEAPQGQQFKLDADVSPDGALLVVREPKDG